MKVVPLREKCEEVSTYTEYLEELNSIVQYSSNCLQLNMSIFHHYYTYHSTMLIQKTYGGKYKFNDDYYKRIPLNP